MMKGETVNTGAPNPGTHLCVMKSGAGWYLGFKDRDGSPYSRETIYFEAKLDAEIILSFFRS